MAIRLTESRLRQIIREERARLLEAPLRGTHIPKTGMLGPMLAPKPRNLRTYGIDMFVGDFELDKLQAAAARHGLKVIAAQPTGDTGEYYDPEFEDMVDAPEVQFTVHGTKPQLRKFYYEISDDGDMSQSKPDFDEEELGLYPVR